LRLSSILTVAFLMLAAPRAGATGTRVLTVFLPSRRAHGALDKHARDLATELQRRWSATPMPAAAADLGARFERAQALAASARFDDAATAFDAVLEDSARQVDRPLDPIALTAAVVKRSAIALARNETERAEELLHRLLRYDPGFTLTPSEASPALRAAFERAATQGPAPIRAADLGEACQAPVEIVLVARAAAADLGPDAVEISRFDRTPDGDGCRSVSSAVAATSRDDAEAVSALVEPMPAAPPAPVIADATPPRPHIAQRALGISALVIGAAFTSAGVYYLVAAHAKSNVNGGCSASMPCSDDVLRARSDAFDSARNDGAITLSIGAAALVGGAIATYFGFRAQHLAVSPTVGGAFVGWGASF
jgi:hypothetical protein